MPKLIVEISDDMQRRIKQQSLDRGKTIKVIITELLEKGIKSK